MRILCGTILAAAMAALSAHGAFDVRDFGAKGDGTTMDTSSIQSAIDKCGESGGGRVVANCKTLGRLHVEWLGKGNK